uniref:receptor-interacting serine/threonine-protein kinase 1-like n=1 Tax=Styela clava TaxID=7725 RepID=UPI00193A7CCC|nr:receptor-interacting serine/threonine-protein kinase 1-like [Styela clava]
MSNEIFGDDHEEEIQLIDIETLEFVEHIDSGGMANISLYKWNTNGSTTLVAKKSLFRGSMTRRYRSNLKKEMAILARLDHENIVRTYGAVETVDDFGLVMEYHQFTSYLKFFRCLWDNIQKTSTIDKVLVPLKIKIISEVISAMNYLHNRNPPILHLDLKSGNVLLNSELHAKICDFGLSQMRMLNTLRSRSTVTASSIIGTYGYIDPQRLQDIHVKPTIKSDVYAFGILQWEILTDKISYEELDNALIAFHVANRELRPDISQVPHVLPEELINMMEASWAQEPSDRPTFEELDDHIQTIINRIPAYKEQVRQSRIQILTLYRSLMERCSFASQSSSQCLSHRGHQPYSSGLNDRRYPLNEGDRPRRPISAPNRGSVTKPMTDDPEGNGHSLRDLTNDELAPLLQPSVSVPRYVLEKKLVSTKKVLLVLALFLSVCAITSVGVVVWKTKENKNSPCRKLDAPEHGNVTCSTGSDQYNIKCNFVCDEGYGIIGKIRFYAVGENGTTKSLFAREFAISQNQYPMGN